MHELGTGRQVWEAATPDRLQGYTNFSPDGSLIVCQYFDSSGQSTERFGVRDATDGRELRTLRFPRPAESRYPVPGIFTDGGRVAVIRGEQVLLADLGPAKGRGPGPSPDANAASRSLRGHETWSAV